VRSDCLRRRIERAWPSAGAEDVRPLRDEPLCGGETDAAIATVMTATLPANVRMMSFSTLSTSHQGLYAQEKCDDAEGEQCR
jgi:hypothetical protein